MKTPRIPRRPSMAGVKARAKGMVDKISQESDEPKFVKPKRPKLAVWLVTNRANFRKGVILAVAAFMAVAILPGIAYSAYWRITYDYDAADANATTAAPSPTTEREWWEPAVDSDGDQVTVTPGGSSNGWWWDQPDNAPATATPDTPRWYDNPPAATHTPDTATATTEPTAPDEAPATRTPEDTDRENTAPAAPEEWAEAFITIYLNGSVIETGRWLDYLAPLATDNMQDKLEDLDSTTIPPHIALAVHPAVITKDSAKTEVLLSDGNTAVVSMVRVDDAWLVDNIDLEGGE